MDLSVIPSDNGVPKPPYLGRCQAYPANSSVSGVKIEFALLFLAITRLLARYRQLNAKTTLAIARKTGIINQRIGPIPIGIVR